MKPVRWRLWPLVGSPVFVFWPGHVGAGAHAHTTQVVCPPRAIERSGAAEVVMSHLIELMNIFSLVDYDTVAGFDLFIRKNWVLSRGLLC